MENFEIEKQGKNTQNSQNDNQQIKNKENKQQAKLSNFLQHLDEEVEGNQVTGEIDSQAIQNAQFGDSMLYKLFPQFSFKSYTMVIIVIIWISFFFLHFQVQQVVLPRRHPMRFRTQDTFVTLEMGCVLQKWGGRFTKFLVDRGDYWRLATSIVMHGDFMQLLLNTFTLLSLGFSIENFLSGKKYLFGLILSGFFANLLAQVVHHQFIFSGACHCIFALFGMNAYNIKVHYRYMGEDRKNQRKQFVYVILTTFFMFWLDREIDYLTLPGSLLIGYLCAWIIYRDYFWGVKSVSVILGVLGIFVGICYYLIKGLDLSTVEYPCEIWDSGKYDE